MYLADTATAVRKLATVMTGNSEYVLSISNAVGSAYLIETLPHPKGPYTFSVWVYGSSPTVDAQMSVSVNLFGAGKSFEVLQDQWTRIAITNVEPRGTEEYIYLFTGTNDTYLFYNAMLEQGTKPSDWIEASEDGQSRELELIERVSSAEQKITNDAIIATVREHELYQSDLSDLRTEIGTTVTQTKADIMMEFEQTKTYAENANSYVEQSKSYINFSDDGILLGRSDSPFTARLNNEKLAFMEDNEEIAYIDNNTMHITNAEILTTLKLGKFSFVPTDTGMALIYTGGSGE